MTVWILSFVVALETAGVEHQFTDRHFYTRVGCEAVAHTANRWAEARADAAPAPSEADRAAGIKLGVPAEDMESLHRSVLEAVGAVAKGRISGDPGAYATCIKYEAADEM